MSRVFIAVPINDEVISNIHNSLSKMNIYDKIRWEPKNKLHVTLKFIGEISDKEIFTLHNTLNDYSIKYNKFSIKVNKLGYFYKNGIPSIFWFNFFNSYELENLKSRLENDLNDIGFEKDDKKFKAHVTLVRVKSEFEKNNILLYKELEIEQQSICIDKIYLMKSELLKSGSVYNKINEYKLN